MRIGRRARKAMIVVLIVVLMSSAAGILSTWLYLSHRENLQSSLYQGILKVPTPYIDLNVPNDELLHVVFLADARWAASTRIAALKKAESMKPHLIINLGDPVHRGTEEQISAYHKELQSEWKGTPLFHLPGGHSRDPSSWYLGMGPYRKYFGEPDYVIRIPQFRLKFICLDNSSLVLFSHQLLWLDRELEKAAVEGFRVILAMHAPPVDPRNKFTKSMIAGSGRLAKSIRKHRSVIAIFSAHTHENMETTWQGIPLEILGVSGSDTLNDKKVKTWLLQVSKRHTLEEFHIDVF